MLDQAIKLGFVIKTFEKVSGKKALHKTIYILQKMGLELGYRFEWLPYGPFSRELATQLDIGLGIGSITKEKGNFSAGDLFTDYKDIFKSEDLSENDLLIIQCFKDKFAGMLNPHILELLASLHFLAKESYPQYNTKDDVFNALEKLKPNRFQNEHKERCWKLLEELSLL